MSNLTTVVNNIISKVNTHTTDLNNKTTQIATHISGITAYHLLQGNLAVSNYTTTQGFNTTLYTGNGSTQSINTGIDMSTQWGNDASETFGGLVWIKGRSFASDNNLVDSVRGVGNAIFTNLNIAQVYSANNINTLLNNGFTTGSSTGTNTSSATYASWNFQTTHRTSGTTNHGKAYTCHYNPFTGFTIVKYEGSGLAGHEIPHMLGRKLGFATVKCTSTINDWWSSYLDNFGTQRLKLNGADASTTETTVFSNNTNDNVIISTSGASNTSGNYYIMYGWANSYLDKSNKLIGNYEIGVYQGTGASGNKVTTRGKPAWVMIKRLDSTANWRIYDNLRNSYNNGLYPSVSNAEQTDSSITVQQDSFTLLSNYVETNASGGQYLYMVAYDTNANGGGSYYPLASDTANVQVNNALIPIAQGIDSNGVKNTILSKNETFSGVTYTQGKNYPYYDALGNRGVSPYTPQYNTYNGFGDYFNVNENKWYNNISTFSDNCSSTSNFIADEVTGGTASSISSVNGELKIVNNGATYGGARFQFNAVTGQRYRAKFSLTSNSTTCTFGIGTSVMSVNLGYVSLSSTGEYSLDFVASGTPLYGMAYNNNVSGAISTWDNITIYPINNDGSVKLSSATEITNGRNYLNHIVYADNDGGVLYVEELPKIEYKDIVKANEFKGKNACTAWVNFDGTTTPPTIRDSYNVSQVIRTATGVYDVYFEEPMGNTNYVYSANMRPSNNWALLAGGYYSQRTINKFTVEVDSIASGGTISSQEAGDNNQIIVFGGLN